MGWVAALSSYQLLTVWTSLSTSGQHAQDLLWSLTNNQRLYSGVAEIQTGPMPTLSVSFFSQRISLIDNERGRRKTPWYAACDKNQTSPKAVDRARWSYHAHHCGHVASIRAAAPSAPTNRDDGYRSRV